jgi:hypothetical protein
MLHVTSVCNEGNAGESPDNLKKSSAQQQNRKRVLFDLGVEGVKKLVDDLKSVAKVAGRASAAVRGGGCMRKDHT